MKIKLVLTGGTIGSVADENGIINTNPETAASKLTEGLYERRPDYRELIKFDVSQPLDLLSENLNLTHLNELVGHLKTIDFSRYHGLIITLGTDTLAFSSNLLAILLEGIGIPVFFIASSKPLTEENANGLDNFEKAIEYLHEEIEPSAYVPFKNKNGEMIIHGANRLVQSQDLSPDFYSAHHKLNNTQKIISDLFVPMPTETNEVRGNAPLLNKINELKGNILVVAPYPGCNYNNYNLEGVDAVLHRTYHSSTVSVATEEDFSIFTLKAKCDERNIPLYFTPLLSTAKQLYSTTDEIIKRGIIPLYDMTFEMSYIYLLLKQSL